MAPTKGLNRASSAIAVPILLAVLLAGLDAAGQQKSPAASVPDGASCVGSGPIVNGRPQPPTPDEVWARQNSPDCRGQVQGAPDVDFSPHAADKLDKIYRKLERIDRSQGDN